LQDPIRPNRHRIYRQVEAALLRNDFAKFAILDHTVREFE